MLTNVYRQVRGLLPQRVRTGLARAAYSAVDLKFRLRTEVNIEVGGLADWMMYNEIFVDGEYDTPIELALERARSGAPLCVVDLGGNVGFFTLRVIDQLRRSYIVGTPCHVLTVEASPRLASILRARVAANRGPNETIDVVQGLVGLRTGEARFAEGEYHVLNHRSTDAADAALSYVDLSPLTKDMPRIDLLKCDIEGSEETFVETYADLLAKVQIAVFELHHRMCNTARVVELLSEYGLTQLMERAMGDVSVACFVR